MNTDFITRAYKREAFIDFLSDFLPDDYEPAETEIYTETGIQRITKAVNLGHVASLDLDVFEFIHESPNDPRVSLTHDAAQIMKKNGNASMALAAFYTETSKSWRFSLIFYGTKLENGKVKREFSNPRRYSFILGPECKKHTPESMLIGKGSVKNVEDLQSRFAVEVVTKEFYNKLFDWYTWATDEKTGVTFPNNTNIPEDDREGLETKIIRLITRIIFVWFIKQKNLVPEKLFEESTLMGILKNFKPQSKNNGDYYNAILQNLFFATLNRAVEDENGNKRGFATAQGTRDVKTLYRYEEMFSIPRPEIIKLFSQIPFLNGGLFECLDKTRTLDGVEAAYNEDGFSRNPATFSNGKPKWRAFVPNILFFDPEKGLFSIFNEYNFTVEENTPYDVDVSLDPELLGKVFENLLGAYNPETQESARKDSGSFYTPREIVNYMVDESLISYLGEETRDFVKTGNVNGLEKKEKRTIYEKLCTIKILDPACGSGAFPMGLLNRIVDLSKKVSPEETDTYTLKLNLIENCIYGSDIQQIAVQICKLRFFISLICECKKDLRKTNFGINPLPNLETKFVCANSLIALGKNHDNDLFGGDITNIENKLQVVRHKHFSAKNVSEKKALRIEDEKLRKKLAGHLQNDSGYSPKEAKLMAEWNPYDQNASSPFFDPEWMFGVNAGFDIVIGNPPYIQLQKDSGKLGKLYQNYGYKTFAPTGDIYSLFYERGVQLLKTTGHLCFITSNKWMRADYGKKTRDYFSKETNPLLLIDFAGVKIFESATVDTNILLLEKGKNKNKTFACVTKDKSCRGNLSDYIQQNGYETNFVGSESWVILNPIEKSIKTKIEKAGIPLKDWDVKIYRGILTGCNDAFIIDAQKRKEILENCKTEEEKKRTAELIRPILRGRDIKRYGYDFANLYLITTHNGYTDKNNKKIEPIDIKNYPAIKKHLDGFWNEIKGRSDKGFTPYNLRNCAYMEDFSRQKIMWAETMRIRKGNKERFPRFSFTSEKFITDKTCFIAVGSDLKYLIGCLNSKISRYQLSQLVSMMDNGGYLMQKIYIEQVKIPPASEKLKMKISDLVESLISSTESDERNRIEDAIDEMIFRAYSISDKEIEYLDTLLSKPLEGR